MSEQNYIQCPILSVSSEVFKGKDGQPDKPMYRLYIADARGRVGYLYSGNAHVAGEVIKLALGERDGKLKLAVHRLICPISNRANLVYKCTAARFATGEK